MCTSSQTASSMPPEAATEIPRPILSAERTYQALTIAAMLWILASLWLFR